MKQEITEIIERTGKEVARQIRATPGVNLYKVTERLLRAYPKLKETVEHPELYGFVPPEKSKDITVAPTDGGGRRDREEIIIDAIESRKLSFERTLARFTEIDAALAHVRKRKEFDVVRMYYFNEDYDGNPVEKALTFEEICDEFSIHGIERSVKSIRFMRTKLVQELTVLLFGVDGAISVECRGIKDGGETP